MPLSPTLESISIRTELQPGDLGRITAMHADLYTREYQFGSQFETYVAKGLSEFYENYNPARSRVWLCDHEDRMVGSLVLMDCSRFTQLYI